MKMKMTTLILTIICLLLSKSVIGKRRHPNSRLKHAGDSFLQTNSKVKYEPFVSDDFADDDKYEAKARKPYIDYNNPVTADPNALEDQLKKDVRGARLSYDFDSE